MNGIFLANSVSSARYHVYKIHFLRVGIVYWTGLCKSTTLVKMLGNMSDILGCCMCIVAITKRLLVPCPGARTLLVSCYTHSAILAFRNLHVHPNGILLWEGASARHCKVSVGCLCRITEC